MRDTEQIGVSGITTDARLDRRAAISRLLRSRLDFDGADATIGFRLVRLIALSEL
jgi:hypothetical protein